MVEKRTGTTGKRRKKLSHHSHDHDNDDISSSIAARKATSSSTGGLDTFLQRLDDIDLTVTKIDHKQRETTAESSILHGDESDLTASSPSSVKTAASSTKLQQTQSLTSNTNAQNPNRGQLLKKAILLVFSLLFLYVLHDTLRKPPSQRLLGEHPLRSFLLWVKSHPFAGAAAFILVYGMFVALLLPGTPLTLGGGYVYKISYGWVAGVGMATLTSMLGSLCGSCFCFVLGRYVMRERVRKWGRKYPLFDAIDLAVSDNGFKIMCLLYLTPILPLGPVSYMCGTTSMPLAKFAAAKIAALPLMLLYVLIGASTDTFMGGDEVEDRKGASVIAVGGKENVQVGVDEDMHRKMVLFGLCLSIVSMTTVSHFVKKELYKIFDKQKKDKGEGDYRKEGTEHVELISRTDNLQRRQRGATLSADNGMLDEETA
ncbi:hypothetical protein ACHAXS_003514 [Conticribra weissflogii]